MNIEVKFRKGPNLSERSPEEIIARATILAEIFKPAREKAAADLVRIVAPLVEQGYQSLKSLYGPFIVSNQVDISRIVNRTALPWPQAPVYWPGGSGSDAD